MYRCGKTAEALRWHFTHKSEGGKMNLPVDSPAWDLVNEKWPMFVNDPRNLRLGLATDGINPFRNMTSKYSCWPVMLVIYNLPPWSCMKKENIMLTLLIPGPNQPGNDIDVYLQPLIDDLKELWNNGVEVFDGYEKTSFNLKALLMWTINDFPAYGNLAGCRTKGKMACPLCVENTDAYWLKFSGKFAYMGHRRFLPPSHPYREKKSLFDGKIEKKGPPRIMTGRRILEELKDFVNQWGKNKKLEEENDKKRKRGEKQVKKKRKRRVQSSNNDNVEDIVKKKWRKRSIFFDLPYWKVNNLDLVHIILILYFIIDFIKLKYIYFHFSGIVSTSQFGCNAHREERM